MAKHIANKIAQFTDFTDLDGNPISDWRKDYIGTIGMACLYESQRKAPGKKFIYFYPNETVSDVQRWFNTISGDLVEEDNKFILEIKDLNERYVFIEARDLLSDDDVAVLWLNQLNHEK